MGWANSDNKFGPSNFIVGPVLGAGVNYNSIQTAINDAFAAGGGCVYIRPGTYTENLTLSDLVDLTGCDVDGRVLAPPGLVTVVGSHTFSPTATASCKINNISFTETLGNDIFTISPTAGGIAEIAVLHCHIESLVGFSHSFNLNPDVASSVFVISEYSNLNAASNSFIYNGAGGMNVQINNCSCQAVGGPVAEIVAGSSSTFKATECDLTGGNFTIELAVNGAIATLINSTLVAGSSSPSSCITMAFGTNSVASFHSSYSCNDVAGFYVSGTGTFSHADSIAFGSAIAIDPGVTEAPYNWQPYARTNATAVGSFRGTASFDSATFTVTDGFVQISGGGITTLTANDTTTTTGTNILLNGVDGITSINAGAGTITIDDKRWLSEFVVDSRATPGTNNAEYTTIQAAYNAADAAGGGTIYIRSVPGASYSEDLSLTSNNTINFVGANGPATNSTNLVVLAGTATVTGTGMHTFTNMQFLGVVDSPFNMTSGGTMQFYFQNCSISSFANNAFNQPSGDLILTVINCSVNGIIDTCRFDGTSIQAIFTDCLIGSNTNSCVEQQAPGTSQFQNCRFIGANFGLNVLGGAVDLSDCFVQGTNECLNIAGGASARLFNVKLFTSAASGFTVTGTGQVIYDSIQSEANTTLDPALTLTPLDWQPYAQAALAPATPTAGAGLRGTSCFDNTQFTVTSGFVQLTNPNGLAWSDRGASGAVTANSGSNATAAITLSLPLAPANGTLCAFLASTAAALVIDAPIATTIHIGSNASTASGTATSTAQGDSLFLYYMSSTNSWWAVPGSQGNWTLA